MIGPERSSGALLVHRDASVYVSFLEPGVSIEMDFDRRYGVYLYLIEGEIELGDERLATGDAARVTDQKQLRLAPSQPSELILVRVEI